MVDEPAADLGVLESVAAALPLCKSVWINRARLVDVSQAIDPEELKLPTWDLPVVYRAGLDGLAGQLLLFNTVNFCYWGDPKWEIDYGGQSWDGAFGMLAALRRALEEGIPVLDGAYLATISEADFEHVLRGRGRLHLMPERLAIWREVGRGLLARFDGRFTNMIAAAQGDAVALARLLPAAFPSFEDVWSLAGRPVRLYKRAQLAVAQLFEAFRGESWGRLEGTGRLTVFADYKLPQVLRHLGILVYDPDLAAAVDSRTLIPAGDPREVEIRLSTVWAVELIRRALSPRAPGIIALHLDYWLWHTGLDQDSMLLPYHHTLTTAY